VALWVVAVMCGLSDFIVSAAGADEAACDDLNLVVDQTFCRRVHCTNFDSEFLIYPLVVCVFIVMAVLYGKVCRRLGATTNVDQGRFMRRQYRGLRTSITVLCAFLVAWFPYCIFVTTIFILMAVDIDLNYLSTDLPVPRKTNGVSRMICYLSEWYSPKSSPAIGSPVVTAADNIADITVDIDQSHL